MARAKVDIPKHQTLQGLGLLSSKQIRAELKQSSIVHSRKALRVDLLPLLALSRLGLVDEDHAADPALLAKVTGWCSSTILSLQQEILNAGIDKGTNKWMGIENLIHAEFENKSNTNNEPNNRTTRSSSQIAISPTKLPAASVMNLLLASFYADMIAHSPQFSAVFPGCPVDNAPKFLEIIDRIHSFTDTRRVTQRITSICQQPKSEGDRLVSWLLATFGSDFIEATYKSGLRIPGFGESVLQFVLPRPVLAHRENFTKHLKNAQNESILLFHGTSTRHLQSILRNGFIPAKDVRFGPGLFMAMEPELASRFAAFQLFDIFTESELNYDSDDVRPDWEKLKPWSNSPFNAHGVLLGCQVAGMGRPVDDDEDNADEGDVHVISQLDSITIRYIFLLPATDPDEEILDIFDDELPDRTEVEPAMTAAFKVIQKGIESLALVDGEAGEV